MLNIGVAAAVTCLILLRHGVADGLIWWLLVFAMAILGRWQMTRKLQHHHLASTRPRETVYFLAAGATVNGMAWALLPICFVDLDLLGHDAPIAVIMGGLISGAALRQSGSSLMSMGFSSPIGLSLGWNFISHGGYVGLIATFELAILISLVYHLMFVSERRFLRGEIAKLQNEDATRSLTIANEDIRQKNLRLETLANGDIVTGLFNRIYFNGRMSGEIITARLNNERVALLLLDIDRFKLINDAFGHRGGDQLLKILGQRFRDAAGQDAVVSRISADEFAILITGPDVRDKSKALAQTLLEAAREPVSLGNTGVLPGISGGLAFFPDHADDTDGLFTSASMALFEAKQAGRKQWRLFDPQLKQRIDRQRKIEQDLEKAILSGKIEAWFQPQVHLASQKVVGFEALVRWFHPELGHIAPPDIVRAAHAMQLSERLTVCIADSACRLLQALPELGLPDATVSLNVSPREFTLYPVSDMLDRLTKHHRIDCRLLEIEITEEAMLDPELAGEQLQKLENAGYKLAVDDFGMGHSSLAYLIGLKVHRLKIDRSFVTDVSNNHTNRALIAAMVSLGNSLNVDIVVEGVETEAELQTLRAMGCDIGQGYFFSRPMPAEMLPNWLHRFKTEQKKSRRAVA
ncbi:putative bifunctional diguanylate cyclase/phosphodiesterase [Rhizobium paknamense]|uniref:putative bifunctional diguanylate cyclase/phosphodiesterase n=1 Tax=Rhizobium paknamense TaxID=1206817 RepID=UPI0027D8ADD8|nr:EAL domain-containing protein [Rhizobium paknamense]